MKRWRFLILMILALPATGHPLKMAYTAVRYDASRRVFEISHRVFQDDFENALHTLYGYSGGDIFIQQQVAVTQRAVNIFFDRNFTFTVNGTTLRMHYRRMEQKQQMGVLVYYETDALPAGPIRSIRIRDTLLTDRFPEQVNMFHLSMGDTIRRTLKFDITETEGVLSF